MSALRNVLMTSRDHHFQCTPYYDSSDSSESSESSESESTITQEAIQQIQQTRRNSRHSRIHSPRVLSATEAPDAAPPVALPIEDVSLVRVSSMIGGTTGTVIGVVSITTLGITGVGVVIVGGVAGGCAIGLVALKVRDAVRERECNIL